MARKRKPLREFSIEIDDLSSDGAGVGRIDGKVWFVDGALPGERVQFREDRRRRRRGQGLTIAIERASSDRVDPPCQYFGTCGGCALQHLDYSAQVQSKQRRLLDDLGKIGNVEPAEILIPMTSAPDNYRRRARLGIRVVPKKGGVLVGFRERKSSYITALDSCITLRDEVSRMLPELPKLIARLSSPARIPQIEVSVGDQLTSLVFRHLEPLSDIDCMSLVDWARRWQVQIYLQPAGIDSVHCIWPPEPVSLSYRLTAFDLDIEFSPMDFVQVNGAINEALVSRAVELMEIEQNDHVLDLFCGVGNFSLPLATRAAHVTGIEGSDELVERARNNAQNNGLTNANFITADLHIEGTELWPQEQRVDRLLIDPPRSGALDVVRQIGRRIESGASSPKKIVYISCNPATLARDCQMLVHEQDYQLTKAGVVDMFPHTAHVESIVVLDRTQAL